MKAISKYFFYFRWLPRVNYATGQKKPNKNNAEEADIDDCLRFPVSQDFPKARKPKATAEKSVGTGPLTVALLDPVFHKAVQGSLADILVRLDMLEGKTTPQEPPQPPPNYIEYFQTHRLPYGIDSDDGLDRLNNCLVGKTEEVVSIFSTAYLELLFSITRSD